MRVTLTDFNGKAIGTWNAPDFPNAPNLIEYSDRLFSVDDFQTSYSEVEAPFKVDILLPPIDPNSYIVHTVGDFRRLLGSDNLLDFWGPDSTNHSPIHGIASSQDQKVAKFVFDGSGTALYFGHDVLNFLKPFDDGDPVSVTWNGRPVLLTRTSEMGGDTPFSFDYKEGDDAV